MKSIVGTTLNEVQIVVMCSISEKTPTYSFATKSKPIFPVGLNRWEWALKIGDYSVVEWTAYEHWLQGVASYTLESGSTSGNLEAIGTWDQLDYIDHSYIEPNGVQKCYRVRALDRTGTWSSRSNVVCLPYQPTLFIPNSFSPNGDGSNDVWQLSSLGFVEMTLKIYDRWGGLVYQGHRGSWDGLIDGKAAPAGVYTYMLSAVAHTGRKVQREGVVQVLR